MRPPLKIELWDANGNAQLLNVVTSIESARRVYSENVGKLRAGETIRVRDSAGALVMSSDEDGRWPGEIMQP
jgi:hypothetical protein